jgi:hypothetical protein
MRHHLAFVTVTFLALGAAACSAGSTTQSPITGGDSGAGGGDGGQGGGDGGNTVLSVDSLSHTCAVDDDCIPVYAGDVCGFCNISNASIAKSAQMAYQDAYNAARANCPPVMGGGSCIQDQNVTVCNAQKTCQLIMCSSHPADAHHCGGDAGSDGG